MKIKLLLYCCILLVCFGCKSYKTKYPYSLEDFRPELREQLEILINENSICNNTESSINYLTTQTNKNELLKVFRSEHPVLRGHAFVALVSRNEIDSGQLILSNLNDSAKITYCNHYGEYFISLSDYYLKRARGKTNLIKDSLFLTLANKNRSLETFGVLANIINDTSEKYYSLIRTSFLEVEEDYNNYNKIELALRLAKYNRNEDTFELKKILYLKQTGINQSLINKAYKTIEIIKAFPNDCFYRVIEQRFNFNRISKNDNSKAMLFKKMYTESEWINDLIFTLPLFKTKQSALLLDKIITENMFNSVVITKDDFIYRIHEELLKNNCDYYNPLIKKYENVVKDYGKKWSRYLSPMESPIIDSMFPKRNPNYW